MNSPKKTLDITPEKFQNSGTAETGSVVIPTDETLDFSISNEKSTYMSENSLIEDYMKKLAKLGFLLEISCRAEKREMVCWSFNKIYMDSREKFRTKTGALKLNNFLRRKINIENLEVFSEIKKLSYGTTKSFFNQKANFIQKGHALNIRRKLAVAPPATDNILRNSGDNNLRRVFKMFKEAGQNDCFSSQFRSKDFLQIHNLCKATRLVDDFLKRRILRGLYDSLKCVRLFSDVFSTKKGKKTLGKQL